MIAGVAAGQLAADTQWVSGSGAADAESNSVAQKANAKTAEHRNQEPNSVADHSGLLNLLISPRALSRNRNPTLRRSSQKSGAASE